MVSLFANGYIAEMNGARLPRYFACTALLLVLGCGGGQQGAAASHSHTGSGKGSSAASKPSAAAPTAPASEAPNCAIASGAGASRGMQVKGITGSLNRGDVHQVMETRTDALMECVEKRPQHLRWVGGRIDFHIKVGSCGEVLQVRPTRSTVGNRQLELCLKEVVAQTRMPRPDGRSETELDWGMNVEPHLGREPYPLDPAELRETLKRYTAETYKACKVLRRTRFEVTAYLGRRGRVLSASAVPHKPRADDKLDCLLEQIGEWKLPRVKRRSKVMFTLKWRPPPPKKRKRYAKKRSRRRYHKRRR